ncbi:hypothetical protein D037_4625B, partial [Vibrio parahaemolyticus IDH02640]
TPL